LSVTQPCRRLDLERNRLTEEGVAALQGLGLPELRVANQQERLEGGGYGEGYLWEGDWE
jgi:hypothetical protein